MIDLTNIVNAVLALLAAVITAFVIPWIRSKATAQQQANLECVVRTLVYAAEQLYGAGNGEEKLAYVVSRMEDKGYTVDLDMIEAAVKQAFGHWYTEADNSDDEEPVVEGEPQTVREGVSPE